MNPRGLLLALLLGFLSLGCTREASVVRRLPEAVRPDAARVVEGNTAFACNLYQRLRGGPGNLFLSPFSISLALAMTYGGARGTTESEMATVLHFPLGQERLHPVFHELLRSVDAGAASSGNRLDVANRLWGQSGHGFLPAYLALTRDQYEAKLDTVDFARHAEPSRALINAWVEEKTRQKIKGLLPPGSLDPNTALVLTNAIYFKGEWLTRFDAGQTRPGAFHVSPTQTVTVPMMRQTAKVAMGYAAGARALELPYAGRNLSMIILLPGLGAIGWLIAGRPLRVVLLGTVSKATGTWLWSWANQGFAPMLPAIAPVRRAAEMAGSWGLWELGEPQFSLRSFG